MTIATDGRRARGDASRRAVLEQATQLASVEGLDGVTIGALATATGRGKSSIATLFGDKERLQLATIDAAAEIYRASVIEPARALPRGTRRVATLLRASLDYSRERVFAGGCFFMAVAADLDSKTGPAADAVRAWMRGWNGYVESQLRFAIDAGELDAATDPERLAFELLALVETSNARSLLYRDERPYALAASAVRERLLAAGADPDDLTPLGPSTS
ncbi:TetR/AcrR family transcriptional regulator [Protaetiibacter sp. SSC-01]|uniref:TetR/AcrR family transcriptional regulator n=1 Tax=Protaetiibacter sp. SSC-01 TaxID=2759943 RepID=UPI0016572AC7|nr:TetR/AcrR family transcriptional regulator [Protaetiibacter sp. SSC-01]QNO37312.1 TetR/AcrR family transcriptional regulator [Protaetiibacter sp. SSC-01]